MKQEGRRAVRSFVRRTGRTTPVEFTITTEHPNGSGISNDAQTQPKTKPGSVDIGSGSLLPRRMHRFLGQVISCHEFHSFWAQYSNTIE